MKKTLLIILILVPALSLSAQDLSFGLLNTAAVSTHFKKPKGLFLGYEKPIGKKAKLTLDMQASYNYQWYDWIFKLDSDPKQYAAYKVEPDNFWFSISSSIEFKLFSKGNFSIFQGPSLSLNYFLTNEKIHRVPGVDQTDITWREKDRYLNRLGLGWDFNFEVKNIFGKQISLFSAWTPQIIAFDKFGLMGGPVNYFILTGTSRIGLKYNLIKQSE